MAIPVRQHEQFTALTLTRINGLPLTMRQITATELHQRLSADTTPLNLLDVREPWETAICQIPGSILIPMRQMPLHRDEFDPNQDLVVICHHGVRSLQVAAFLERMGHQAVINLQGGIAAWAEQVDQAMPRY